jgi:hypothetical protein
MTRGDEMTSSTETTGTAAAQVPAQRVPRDEAIREARREYAERAREGDLAAMLAPYHR